MNKEIEEYSASIEFKIKTTESFSVIIKAWQMNKNWMWNVYALIGENHKLFNDPEKAYETLPFHGGCTYDQLIEYKSSKCTKYSDDSGKTLKLGSDYMHLHDDYDNHSSPLNMIPYSMLLDAKDLVKELEK